MANDRQSSHEQTPLLNDNQTNGESQVVAFSKGDDEDPRQWSRRRKMINVAIIALMSILSPLASSIFTPAMAEIAASLGTNEEKLVSATSGFVVMLGIGPLILAPLSETFGRRTLYILCFTIFTLLQIPIALSPNLVALVVCRTFAGFFGSVGIANGGGTLNDMFEPSERAGVYGWYLLGPLMGPSIGPLMGGIIVELLNWRWMFGILAILCAFNTLLGYLFLAETYAPTILTERCRRMEKEHGGRYTFEGYDNRPLPQKVLHSLKRPLKILFFQPIVLTLATYQAIIFINLYSLFTNMEAIFGSEPYNFSTLQVGLLYLGPGLGFVVAVRCIVPYIDTVYTKLAERWHTEPKPEYRLPLANIGAIVIPITLFWFAWTVEYRVYWLVPIAATPFFALGQVSIFNTVQNYYIDAFSQYAASAIAAGAMFRSLIGGIVPLMAPALFRAVGYGWGWSIFGLMTLVLTPSPLLFMKFGERLRERYKVDL